MARTPSRKAKPGAASASGRAARGRRPGRFLQYKVVELSTVDEGALEHTVNHWAQRGWNLDGVQFAMRESSKRPSMAFVFFTRDEDAPPVDDARTPGPAPAPPLDPWARLARLAEDDDGEGGAT